MVRGSYKIRNPKGIHMRPAGVLARSMSEYQSQVWLEAENKKVNAKSLLSLLGASIRCGDVVTIECDGVDEEEALARAMEDLHAGLGENLDSLK
ncbi:MAG: HPr family phosphocarrier protein [Lachnospiraceae bacterium]